MVHRNKNFTEKDFTGKVGLFRLGEGILLGVDKGCFMDEYGQGSTETPTSRSVGLKTFVRKVFTY